MLEGLHVNTESAGAHVCGCRTTVQIAFKLYLIINSLSLSTKSFSIGIT